MFPVRVRVHRCWNHALVIAILALAAGTVLGPWISRGLGVGPGNAIKRVALVPNSLPQPVAVFELVEAPGSTPAPNAPTPLAGPHSGAGWRGVRGHGHGSPHGGGRPDDLATGPIGDPYPMPPELVGVRLNEQSDESIALKSAGCVQCHRGVGNPHAKDTVRLGCVDCHGGNAQTDQIELAHVQPRHPHLWPSSANPVRSYTLLNQESPEFIRFVNPGDLRIAHISCGTAGCHAETVHDVRKSMMTHGAMLWEAALYNNGAVPFKQARYGESYSMFGTPQRLQTVPPPSPEEIRDKGILPYLDPLPKFQVTQPGNLLRIFERGGRFAAGEIGIPERLEETGRPRQRLSTRGLGTGTRTDPVFLGLQKTRLLDPTLNFLGTNDHAGDYRSSGCTACHVVYANDRSPVHSGPFAVYGNEGKSFSVDPMIPKDEPGHPIEHRFVWAPPTSQCNVCHIHPGTTVMNSYVGFMWWDLETDGKFMYPPVERELTAEEFIKAQMSDPNEASARGLWSNPEFLKRVAELNPMLEHTQFADFHGHGWVYRAVFKKDRKGQLLDAAGNLIEKKTTELLNAAMVPPSPDEILNGKECRNGVPLHLMDIHMEKGMHCVDCHFAISGHGNGKLYGEVRNAIEIQCIDCHGTSRAYTTLRTSGPASPPGGMDLASLRSPWGGLRFEWIEGKLYQRSMVTEGLEWEVVQTKDSITPGHEHYNQKSHHAKTVRFNDQGEIVWGDLPPANSPAPYDDDQCAHSYKEMSCIACHSSWNPSCYGCHLPQKANLKLPELHNEGDVSRNGIAYNWQTLRDDVYMLARDGHVTGNRIGPSRSSCAIHVGSYNDKRESIYVQQQTISAEGLSGIAFSTNVPHTVRGGPATGPDGRALNPANYLPGRNETKQCTDCHVSINDDNNAIMAQLVMQGTGALNFIGRYAWVAAGEEGLLAVAVTERDEPQTVIGSTMHRMVYPQRYAKHLAKGKELENAYEHPGVDIIDGLLKRFRQTEILSVQARGEYLYAACGEGGMRVFDIAFIDHKGFSERITTAPVSPLGQRFFVRTKDCRDVAAPTTIAPDPTRTHRPENMEQAVHPVYAYLYLADAEEGLILVGAGTLLDGDPTNNFLKRDLTFNPGGLLHGARRVKIVGHYAYVCCDAGLVIVDLDTPTEPKITAILGHESGVHRPVDVAVQFRYAFVVDADGLQTLDVTDLAHPRTIPDAEFPIDDAHRIYVARTYAYLAAGHHGLVILDVENPERPRLDQVFNDDGKINDLHDVQLGITYNSQFAYLADGRNGFVVVQLTSPETPGNDGFSPRPTPEVVAHHEIPNGGHALAISRGLDRDRAVDESGHQIAVFGRIGARPLNREELHRLYIKNGWLWKVSDDPQASIYRYQPPAGETKVTVPPAP